MHASAVPLDKQMREGILEKLIHLIRYAAAGTGSNGIIKLRYLLTTAASSFLLQCICRYQCDLFYTILGSAE